MIISPPLLPPSPVNSQAEDPLMDELDKLVDAGGMYPVAFDRRWHTGLHLVPWSNATLPVRAIADGEVVAYRVCQQPIADVFDDKNTNAGFVLLKHTTETGENRTLTFYSLYMHLHDLSTMVQDGIQPPPVNAPHTLPGWLRQDTGGPVSGGGKKIRRKDILGYVGQCQGHRELHFEIFMAPKDFDAYFGATQLGHPQPTTPQGSDYWGHSYYVIPANQTFSAQPPGVNAQNKLHGIEFLPKQGGQNPKPLYVEVYYHKGDKFTRVLSVESDGSWTSLTLQPIVESQFEYDMYKRATALYPACPSDGYEMLRFGRILSTPSTLNASAPNTPPPLAQGLQGNPHPQSSPSPRATWIRIAFAPGQEGYIDISSPTIRVLSDADFPFFKGWQKIQATAGGPFDQSGLWDLDKLKALVRRSIGNIEGGETGPATGPLNTPQKNQAMRNYLSDPSHKTVRELVHGFICEAPSEWDRENLDPRYRDLLHEGEHFEGNPDTYKKFLEFVGKLQFWDKTGLTPGGKVWFFHPLAFIRHFRRCSWLDLNELSSTFPRHMYYTQTGNPRRAITQGNNEYSLTKTEAETRIFKHASHINNCIRKYLGHDKKRASIFLAQVLLETAQWRNLGGTRRLMHEWGFGKYSPANPATQYYSAFYGRGIMQLTWAGNYESYGNFKIIQNHSGPYIERLSNTATRITQNSTHYSQHPNNHGSPITWFPRFDPDIIAEDPDLACDSGGFYWVSKPFSGGLSINRVADREYSPANIDFINKLVNGGGNGYYERQAYTVFMLNKLSDIAEEMSTTTITPPNPKSSIILDMKEPI